MVLLVAVGVLRLVLQAVVWRGLARAAELLVLALVPTAGAYVVLGHKPGQRSTHTKRSSAGFAIAFSHHSRSRGE